MNPNDTEKAIQALYGNADSMQPRNTPGNIPPQAIDFEQAVLGAILLQKSAFYSVSDILTPEMFYRDDHRLIYTACTKLIADGQPIDVLTVKRELEKQGKLKQIGGVIALTSLSSNVASGANVKHHASRVAGSWMLRQIIEIGQNAAKEGFKYDADPEELLGQVSSNLMELTKAFGRGQIHLGSETTLSETIEQIQETQRKVAEGSSVGVDTGSEAMKYVIGGFQNSDLIVLAGRPSMGKTDVALNFLRACAESGTPALFFSLEMSTKQVMTRMLSAYSGVERYKIRDANLNPNDWDAVHRATETMRGMGIYVDDNPTRSMFDILAISHRMKRENNIGMVVIDYLQLVNVPKSENRNIAIGEASRIAKQLAKQLDIPVILLSQLSRAVEARGGDKRPINSDLRDSGEIEQNADVIGFVYRAEYYGIEEIEDRNSLISTENICEVRISKNRNGKIGKVYYHYDRKTGVIKDHPELNEKEENDDTPPLDAYHHPGEPRIEENPF